MASTTLRQVIIVTKAQSHRPQKGIALVVALVLLVAVTLVGLAAIRGTSLQEKMAGNLMDHDVALQSAEAGLRAAAKEVLASTAPTMDCSTVNCDPDDPLKNPGNYAWHSVGSTYTAGALAGSQPYYVAQYMGLFSGNSQSISASGAVAQYGSGNTGGGVSVPYYRITACNVDPTQATDRSVVMLQAWIKG